MQSSQSSSSSSEKSTSQATTQATPIWITAVTWAVRLIIGAVFTFSGFVKGIDPWGTVYKFDEYLAALGIPMSHGLIVVGVFALCILEFMIGVFMLFGCYRRSNPVLAMLFMVVMLPLTLWIAISDPVADCGCFGDAFIISNWATFWKNVLLTVCVVWLLIYNSKVPCVITPAFQWIASIATSLFLFCICWYGYNIQPMIDFRPYKVGVPLVDESKTSQGPQFAFIYSKDGMEQEFTEDNLPDEEDGWMFISRRELPYPAEKQGTDHSFSVMDKEGNEDATADAIDTEGGEFLLLIPTLNEVSATTTYKINMLNDWAEAHDIRLVAVIASHTGNIADWEDLSMPRYDIYTADDTSIKELSRGNPSVLYLENDTIRWKSTLGWLNEENFSTPDTKADVKTLGPDGSQMLRKLLLIYLAVMAFLMCISMIPRLTTMFKGLGYKGPQNLKEYKEYRESRANRDDKARHEE